MEDSFFQYEEIYDFSGVTLEMIEHDEFTQAAESWEEMELWLEAPSSSAAFSPEKPKNVKLPKPPVYQSPHIARGHPKIAIIIDDMGMDRKRSQALIEMKTPLTLSFLPYAPGVRAMARKAQEYGHELMIHMPMEAMEARVSLGGIALRAGMSPAEIEKQMDEAFGAFEGYRGMNNHMGSRLTQDAAVMALVMESLKEKGLYFVDSKTISSSVAGDVARAYGLRAADRDVFLDHVDTPEFARSALRSLEKIADRKGYAIAIGHPKTVTIEALKSWIPDAQARGYEIVSASRLLSQPIEKTARVSRVETYGPPRPPVVLTSDPLTPRP